MSHALYDITPDFRPNAYDSQVGKGILRYEGTPEAIRYFARVCGKLSDSAYWFFLSTLWVSYSGGVDLNLWRRLFSSKRPLRKTSVMKPSELKGFEKLPEVITVYRASKPGDKDWINYTTSLGTARIFATVNGGEINRYEVQKSDCIAWFKRRGECEIIMLDPSKAMLKGPEAILPNE